jgi:arylformamidase
MIIKDITLTITPGMVVWPGDDAVQLYRQQKIEDGANANVSFVGMSVHTGTHVDAPYHFLKEGRTIEQIPVELFVGETQVIQIPENVTVIDAKALEEIQFNPGITNKFCRDCG